MSDHKDLHRSIEEFRSSIEEAKASEVIVASLILENEIQCIRCVKAVVVMSFYPLLDESFFVFAK